jgi:hypothetical protein
LQYECVIYLGRQSYEWATKSSGMASDATPEVYDLLIIVDATSSMFNYIESLKTSLPKVIAISKLTNSFARIGLLAYRDYSEANHDKGGILEWSGWYHPENPNATDVISVESLMNVAANLEPSGGGDFPEATKTALARAYSLMDEHATTIVLLYTDAPPHCWMVADRDPDSNYHAEQTALSIKDSYGGYGPYFTDWVSACKQLHTGPKKAAVFCFLDEAVGGPINSGYYTYLSTVTRGACLRLTDSSPHSIAQVTVEVLLAWMGAQKAGVGNVTLPARLVRYKKGDNIKQVKNERDSTANAYFWAHSPTSEFRRLTKVAEAENTKVKGAMAVNIAIVEVDTDVLARFLPKKKTPAGDFAQRYAKDERYKTVVVEQLRSIIETDVTSMSLNPVFGALWRAVCNDRDNPAREEVITAFSLHVDRISDVDEKARMKNWLEESYDYAAEILYILEQVPEEQRFPCVFLDPTIEFRPAATNGQEREEQDDDGNHEDRRPITAFRRDELLEIGRSCDGRILRRLGKVLTQLTYVETPADLPSHVAATTIAVVPRIPISLASKEHGWKFWKILLHVVLRGTMLAARPSTVLAALAIRIGLKPLFKPAFAAMLYWRDKWNNLDIPETWNASCLGLLLDADEEHQKQIVGTGKLAGDNGLLLLPDRQLFSTLVTYQHTGANLLTTLTAEIGWTPDKTQMPVGPVVVCRGCHFPRSVTIMGVNSGGKCGLCIVGGWSDRDHRMRSINSHVAREDTETSNTTWVECSIRTCRAQYVCYNPSDLNVRPKCHYCRIQTSLSAEEHNKDPAPTLQCSRCLNKVIWPHEYRAMVAQPFECVACQHGCKSIAQIETNAQQICKENGQSWLLRNQNDVLKSPFKRSIFHTISTVGSEAFRANIQALPTADPGLVLTLQGKRLHNQTDLLAELKSWVQRRTAERSLCSLCFDSFPKSRLLPACRRRGCHQQICETCLDGWYGTNRAGSIINIATLFCPFCRRPPAARTLAAYGKGVHAVGDLIKAVNDRGQWIYTWCFDCGKAKQYMERQCTRGAPDPLYEWKCQECMLSKLEHARNAEVEARRALDRATGAQQRATALHRFQQAARLRKTLECPVKECPGCKTPTQKTAGCDHMECSMPNCDTHWCWSCGEGFTFESIYRHLDMVHGGWYTG